MPNQAFLHARPDDQFWAAQKLAAITTDMIRAAVDAGDFRDPDAEAFLVRALAERRDATARAYLPAVNPIADPTLDADGRLTFRNAAVDADVARAPRAYRAVWFTFDNATRATALIGTTQSGTTYMRAPAPLPTRDGAFVKVELSSTVSDHEPWATAVHAYFRLHGGTWQLAGFERMPERG
ncbi:MAG: hypothetical protein QM736_02530 [Vicinamibacterales bacterium]